jgi:hypothetical protein
MSRGIRVEAGRVAGPLRHVAAGALYGVADARRPGGDALRALAPRNLTQMAPDGGQLPNGESTPSGDAVVVADLVAGLGTTVTVRLADSFPEFPYIWRGWDDWTERVRHAVGRVRASGVPALYAYELWNEPNWTWDPAAGDVDEGWTRTARLVREAHPGARLMGPSLDRWDAAWMRRFLAAARATDTLPDVVSWHELDPADVDVAAHMAEYRSIERELGIARRPVSINEYGPHRDMAVPSALVEWIARLEHAEVDTANLAFWHKPGRMSDLVTPDGISTGGGRVYEWYAALSGDRLAVSGEALAVRAEQGGIVVLVPGDGQGDCALTVGGLPDGRIPVSVERARWTGTDGPLDEVEILLAETREVVDGTLELRLAGGERLAAFRVSIGDAAAREASPARFRARYEAEDAVVVRGSINRVDMRPSAFRSNRFSGDGFVEWLNEVDSTVDFLIEVPASGAYRLVFGYGNGGSAASFELVVDGEPVRELDLPPTQGHELIGTASASLVLAEGRHRIALVRGPRPGSIALDFLDVEAAEPGGRQDSRAGLSLRASVP